MLLNPADTNGCGLCPTCYQLIYQAINLQATSLSSLKNRTEGALQLFDGYSVDQIKALIQDINSTLKSCSWPRSLDLTALINYVNNNNSLFLTVSSHPHSYTTPDIHITTNNLTFSFFFPQANNSLTSMLSVYDGMVIDLGTAKDMLQSAENYVLNFNRSIFSNLLAESMALNKSALNLYYLAGNCSMSLATLSTDVDALWNGSAVLNMTLAGLLSVLNNTYIQAYNYADFIRQFNASLVELQSNITAIGSRAQYLNTLLNNLGKDLTNATAYIILLNTSLTLVSQNTADVIAGAGVLQGYVEKISDLIRKASESSLSAFNATSKLMVSYRVAICMVKCPLHCRMRVPQYMKMLSL